MTTRIGWMRGKSAAAKTRPLALGGTVIPRMRACACGLRTNATSIVPGSLMSDTNSPRPCRWRSSSRRSNEAPTPQASFGIRRPPGEGRRGLGDRGDDVGVAGAAAQIAGETGADRALRAGLPAPDQVARGDQHRRGAKAALQPVMAVKAVAQCRHHR